MRIQSKEVMKDDIASVFSLLPDAKAKEATTHILNNLQLAPASKAHLLKWVEFEFDGEFIRGGKSDILELSTEVITNATDDKEINILTKKIKQEGLKPGLLEPTLDGDSFLWYLPFTADEKEKVPTTKIRTLIVSLSLFKTVIDFFSSGSSLTQSEIRVAFQIICGLTPKKAADADNVSVETKRSQIKSVCAKLSCSGQKELTRIVMGQMVHLLTLSNTELPHGQIAESFIVRYLKYDASLRIQRLSNGRLMRYLESGPSDGVPVVMIHGMMFPVMMINVEQHLKTNNVRLITPIRQGFLENPSISTFHKNYDLMDETFDDIALFLEEYCEAPAVILGNSLGAVLATRFANSFPNLVSKLILLSINLTQTRDPDLNPAGRFYRGMQQLSSKHDLFKQVNWQYKKYYADPETSRHILHRLFELCETDIAVLNGEYSKRSAYEMFANLYENSIVGIIDDFGFVFESWRSELEMLDVPVLFIHGLEDPLTNVDEFKKVVKRGSKIDLETIEGGGHFIAASHSKLVWKLIKNYIK